MARPWRVALAGIAAESCTFSPLRSSLADFVQLAGEELLASEAAADFAAAGGLEIRGGLLARALPGGVLEREAFAALRARLRAELEPLVAQGLDGVLLDLHGALAAEGCEDAELELLREIRQIAPGLPLGAAFDLHGNLSAAAAAELDVLTAYRTAPHVDVAATRARAAALLIRRMAGEQPSRADAPIPALLTGEQTATTVEPGRSLWNQVAELAERPGIWDASLFVGYAWADEERAGARAVCYADRQEDADAGAELLRRAYWDRREDCQWPAPLLEPAACPAWIDGVEADGPAWLSDAADNPTAGGVGDEHAMLDVALADADRAWLVAGVTDPECYAAAAAAGPGAQLELAVGGRLTGRPNPRPVRYEVVKIAAGVAVLRHGATTLLCAAKRRTFHELDDYARLGVALGDYAAVALKVGYLPPAIADGARAHRLVAGPGCVPPDITKLAYRRARFDYPATAA
ncbi:MAG: M81 family metallopeptidase [Betaproteobacteria bacterium AqS2]|uniref:M81 family metallopeptidase n=1 Tax=Candidatus Amphirhobacter heronislandensis TaxID=1732024 RepID=A0A930UFT7_9GAMM|nr:M81 family metallopeptidase [Betaproteobacteria bacterium AqS2]